MFQYSEKTTNQYLNSYHQKREITMSKEEKIEDLLPTEMSAAARIAYDLEDSVMYSRDFKKEPWTEEEIEYFNRMGVGVGPAKVTGKRIV